MFLCKLSRSSGARNVSEDNFRDCRGFFWDEKVVRFHILSKQNGSQSDNLIIIIINLETKKQFSSK